MDNTVNTGSCKMVVGDFAAYFISQTCAPESSAARLLALWFPGGAKCASCGAPITGKRALDTFWKGYRTYCAACDSKFSPWSHTLLDGSKLTAEQLEIILLGMSLDLPPKTIATLAAVLPETVNNWMIKIRFWESNV
jgi:hypothetical protein